ncbi:MAG TPA: hypothetical protein VL400_11340 [Polyangiaceae bacterium]|jgi:hypothetical protein|nr:hypothetical protein [Polyangiaceae bacterium]
MSDGEDYTRVTKGKYYLIEVPNFNDSESAPMMSYLRLGAVKDVSIAGKRDAAKETGEDLASYVTEFIDDTRLRDGCDKDGEFTFISEKKRIEETSILHTKGGWRDHSDGNRISTTRGDKVEVIRGNYKLVVLGRTDKENDAAVVDISGGHIAENPITIRNGFENKIEWVQNYDGTWKVTESVTRGDVTSTYHGDTVDFFYGKLKESTTGSEAPEKYFENPAITDRTWARSIASYTGSGGLPVPTIHDSTHAGAITSDTTADSITSTTNAGAMVDTTTVGTMTSTTTAGAITDTTTAGIIANTTIGNVQNTTIGNESSLSIGTQSEIIIGPELEVIIGAESSITIGATLDLQVALILSLAISGGIEIDIGPKLEISMFHLNKDISLFKINALDSKISSAESKLSAAGKWLAGSLQFG